MGLGNPVTNFRLRAISLAHWVALLISFSHIKEQRFRKWRNPLLSCLVNWPINFVHGISTVSWFSTRSWSWQWPQHFLAWIYTDSRSSNRDPSRFGTYPGGRTWLCSSERSTAITSLAVLGLQCTLAGWTTPTPWWTWRRRWNGFRTTQLPRLGRGLCNSGQQILCSLLNPLGTIHLVSRLNPN